jgi:hypothetical protein
LKKMENHDMPKADKSDCIKLEFFMHPDNPALDSRCSQ